jgi:hypothetical protein
MRATTGRSTTYSLNPAANDCSWKLSGSSMASEGSSSGGKSGTGSQYGKWQVPALAKQMAMFPRFKVPALNRPALPQKRIRRNAAQISTDAAAKVERRARRTKAA